MRSRPVTPTKLSVTERLSRAKWHVYHQAVLIWVQLCGISSPPPLLFASLGSSLQRPQCQEAYMACKLQHPGGGNVFTKALGRSQDLGSRV